MSKTTSLIFSVLVLLFITSCQKPEDSTINQQQNELVTDALSVSENISKTANPEKWLNRPDEDSYFVKNGSKIKEISRVNGHIFTFTIQRRDSQFLYCKDASRGMELRLPINKSNRFAQASWRSGAYGSWNLWREFKYITYIPEKWLNQPNEDSYFVKDSNTVIKEVSQKNGVTFTFNIQRRDYNFLYCIDYSRGLQLRLPINQPNRFASSYWRQVPNTNSNWNLWREFKYIKK